jgi:hypothetical protein
MRERCITCKGPLGSPYYGAGNGTGRLFRCAACHWRYQYQELHKAIMPIMHNRGRVASLPAGELAKELVLALAKEVPLITGSKYEEYC